jgi:prefoldin beta subunit
MQSSPSNLSPQHQQEIVRLQQLQQSLEVLIQQRMNMESQAREMENAVKELDGAPEDAVAYKSIGGIFIRKPRNELLEFAKERKQTLEMRIKSLQNQETNTKSQYEKQKTKVQDILKDQGIS